MGLAEYFERGAVAASQVLAGFDPDLFKERLSSVRLAVGFSRNTSESREGANLLDLLVRLLARLYPCMAFDCGSSVVADVLSNLALSINPNVDLGSDEPPTIGIWVGPDPRNIAPVMFYAGSNEWMAYVSTSEALPVGMSSNPFGAGAAACLASANLFRCVFLGSDKALFDNSAAFSVLRDGSSAVPLPTGVDLGETTLVGVGAIGNATVWSFARMPAEGTLHLVDPELTDLGNLQRYILSTRSDVEKPKVEVAARYVDGSLKVHHHQQTWAEYTERFGYAHRAVLVAVDSARDRRSVQASLPEWIANAWTQPGDLGVSTHRFDSDGACLACLYLPQNGLQSEDAIVADALRVPDRLMEVRELLYRRAGAPRELLEVVASRLGVNPDRVIRFEGQELRKLYVEGICGGAVIPLGQSGPARADVHVPLAHQSALAGVLLGSALIAERLGIGPKTTCVTRINVLRPLPSNFLTQPALKDPRRICLCQDPDYVAAYRAKYRDKRSLEVRVMPARLAES